MTDPSQAPARRRWLWPVLIVSLALNLLIAGIIVGALSQRAGGGERVGGPARSLLGQPFVQALEGEDRRAIGRAIVQNREVLKENRSDLRGRIERLLDTLRAETFDRDTAAALLREQRQLAVTRQEFGEMLLLDRLEAMSVEERRGYADRLSKELRRFRRD